MALVGLAAVLLVAIVADSIPGIRLRLTYHSGMERFERWYVPMMGVAVFMGLAGWATYTPSRNRSFAKTLAILFGFGFIGYRIALATRAHFYLSSGYWQEPEILDHFFALSIPLFITATAIVAYRQHLEKVAQEKSLNRPD